LAQRPHIGPGGKLSEAQPTGTFGSAAKVPGGRFSRIPRHPRPDSLELVWVGCDSGPAPRESESDIAGREGPLGRGRPRGKSGTSMIPPERESPCHVRGWQANPQRRERFIHRARRCETGKTRRPRLAGANHFPRNVRGTEGKGKARGQTNIRTILPSKTVHTVSNLPPSVNESQSMIVWSYLPIHHPFPASNVPPPPSAGMNSLPFRAA